MNSINAKLALYVVMKENRTKKKKKKKVEKRKKKYKKMEKKKKWTFLGHCENYTFGCYVFRFDSYVHDILIVVYENFCK